jgi:hypothetical protein
VVLSHLSPRVETETRDDESSLQEPSWISQLRVRHDVPTGTPAGLKNRRSRRQQCTMGNKLKAVPEGGALKQQQAIQPQGRGTKHRGGAAGVKRRFEQDDIDETGRYFAGEVTAPKRRQLEQKWDHRITIQGKPWQEGRCGGRDKQSGECPGCEYCTTGTERQRRQGPGWTHRGAYCG